MVPMAGLEPARAVYGPTDFKSVASAISPHRLFSFLKAVFPMKIGLFLFIFIVSRLVIEQYRTVSVAHSLYVCVVNKKNVIGIPGGDIQSQSTVSRKAS
jgi:hypothetical protein